MLNDLKTTSNKLEGLMIHWVWTLSGRR